MHLRITFALIPLFLFLFSRAEAQTARAEYFITLTGDTLQADISNASDSKNTFSFEYKTSASGNRYLEYTPADVKEVVYGNEKYVSTFVSDAAFNQMVFLKLLIEGPVNLYKAVDAKGETHFLFSEAPGDIILLRRKTYSGLLKTHLKSCVALNLDDPAFVRKYGYSTTGLSDFFIAYNACAYPGMPVIVRKNKSELYLTKGVTAGMASSNSTFNVLVAKPGSYGTYSHITAGVFGELHFSKHLSTLLALQYHPYEGQMLDPDAFYKEEIYVSMKYIMVPLLLKYTTTGKTKLFVNAGPHADWLIDKGGRRNYSNIEFTYNPRLSNLSIGMTGGVGAALSPFANGAALTFEARYSHTSLYSGVNVGGTLTSFQVLAGLNF